MQSEGEMASLTGGIPLTGAGVPLECATKPSPLSVRQHVKKAAELDPAKRTLMVGGRAF